MGAKGAQVTCALLISAVRSSLLLEETITEEIITTWIEDIRLAIANEAASNELTPRDFACTLVGAVISQNLAVFFQIGDGAIVVRKNNIWGVVFWPEPGQYANMTYFLTDDDALSRLRICSVKTDIGEVALMSDGLQRLALIFDKQSPHPPFFDQMFLTLRRTPTENLDNLQFQLNNFLSSDLVNERTDDDKTLILATNMCE
jgi:serine/threonine protein phosphatase PrpC